MKKKTKVRHATSTLELLSIKWKATSSLRQCICIMWNEVFNFDVTGHGWISSPDSIHGLVFNAILREETNPPKKESLKAN